MAPLVSILIPAYNAEKWIVDTVKSALDQTWPNKEIIIVDDGSRDNTLDILKTLESKAVKVAFQENTGSCGARNKALSLAQGEYIQWLDADDLLAPSKIAEQMKFAESGQEGTMLFSGAYGIFYWRPEKAKFVANSLWQDLTAVEYMVKHLSENIWMSPAVWLVSRRLTEKIGPWDERLSLNDDGEYFCRAMASSQGVKFVREARCYYRMSGINQLSRSQSERACRSLLLSQKLCIQYLRSLEDSERTKRASHSALQSCLPYFYPDKVDLLQEINALASELGGTLESPSSGWKLTLIRKLFGRQIADEAVAMFRRFRLATAIKWDEMLYRTSR